MKEKESSVWTPKMVAKQINEIQEENKESMALMRDRLNTMSRRLHRIGHAIEDEDYDDALRLWKEWYLEF